jgi:hypothetical protein
MELSPILITFCIIKHERKYNKIERIPYILTNQNGIALEITEKKTTKTIETHGD